MKGYRAKTEGIAATQEKGWLAAHGEPPLQGRSFAAESRLQATDAVSPKYGRTCCAGMSTPAGHALVGSAPNKLGGMAATYTTAS